MREINDEASFGEGGDNVEHQLIGSLSHCFLRQLPATLV